MKATTLLAAFVGGALVGAGAAMLFAPEKGEDLRAQIKALMKKHGLCKCACEKEIDGLVDQIADGVQEVKK